ncbi:MAG: sulfatase-like hydrolase/transferase [Chloroflexi bacterium]|nr:sulfatase-like hydrolase/transferase [Chloroflexota bacterium]
MDTRHHPNIILILADSLGFSDLGCFGGEIDTPHLDRLAEKGLRISQFYSSGESAASQAALMTGLYAHQAGMGHGQADEGLHSYQGRLLPSSITLAELLKAIGYQTALSGIWRLSDAEGKLASPYQRGFDHAFFAPSPAASYHLEPPGLSYQGEAVLPSTDNFHLTEAISNHARWFLQELIDQGAPFFLTISHQAPRYPLHAHPPDIPRFAERYRLGWDLLRLARHRRLIELGLIDSKWMITPRDLSAPAWEEVSQQNWETLRMASHALLVNDIDHGLGKLLEVLDEAGITQNTLILFMSLSGATSRWLPDNQPENQVWDSRLALSLDLPWANLSNTPFREYSGSVHEGGIASPFIAHWPGQIEAGQICDRISHLIDLMPSLLDLTGADYPSEAHGESITPLQGLSLLATLNGEVDSEAAERTLCWEFEGHSAVRQGRWKLVRERFQKWELYDMIADRTELNDLARYQPEQVKEMAAVYTDWVEACGVEDWRVILERQQAKLQDQTT